MLVVTLEEVTGDGEAAQREVIGSMTLVGMGEESDGLAKVLVDVYQGKKRVGVSIDGHPGAGPWAMVSQGLLRAGFHR